MDLTTPALLFPASSLLLVSLYDILFSTKAVEIKREDLESRSNPNWVPCCKADDENHHPPVPRPCCL